MARRKSAGLNFLFIAVLLFVGIITSSVYTQSTFDDVSSYILPLIILFGTLVTVTTLGFLWYQKMKKLQALQMLEIVDIDKMTGVEFERYVGEILSSRGFHIEYTPTSGDYGVDIIARRGGERWAVQMKRYSNSVGREAISDAVAGMAYYKCTRSMVVTSNYFTPNAQELAKINNTFLVDRDKLAQWMLEFKNAKHSLVKGGISSNYNEPIIGQRDI